MVELIPACALLLTIVVDLAWGDPPNRLHPVVAMGNWIAWSRRQGLRFVSNRLRFGTGLLSLSMGIIMLGGLGWAIELATYSIPFLLAICLQAAVLKSTLSVRSLLLAAKSVADALNDKDLPLARQRLAYHLVSRDTKTLDASSVAAATIESVAENTSDSLVAPLFYYVVAGLPGVLIYRYVNTCDAMIGYRTPELEWLGKAAARCDDLLNLIPSRLTALLMLLVGAAHVSNAAGRSQRLNGLRIWWRDHRLTSSPNAGHPMSAASGLLGVELEKVGHYCLGANQPRPDSLGISAVNSLLVRTTILATLLAIVCSVGFQLTALDFTKHSEQELSTWIWWSPS